MANEPSFLDRKLERLDALYHKFGVDGLKDCSLADIKLLVAAKKLAGTTQGFDLEIMELKQHLKAMDSQSHHLKNLKETAANLPRPGMNSGRGKTRDR